MRSRDEVRKVFWLLEGQLSRLNQWGNSELKVGCADNNGDVERLKLAKGLFTTTSNNSMEDVYEDGLRHQERQELAISKATVTTYTSSDPFYGTDRLAYLS